MANVTPTSLTNMTNNGTVTTDVLVRICNSLQSDISDIVEILEWEK